MRRAVTITIVSVLMSGAPCFSQIQAPKQVDTLHIKSMQYHFDEIRPENWPFSYVLRTPGSFMFNGESFPITESTGYGSYIEFKLRTGDGHSSVLKYSENDAGCRIEFSGYILCCTKADAKGSVERKSYDCLGGRTVDNAGFKMPEWKNWQENGCLVVDIWVDQYGKVVKAIPGADGTTITDNTLWNSARTAALETGFNMKADAPQLQKGRITYCFDGGILTTKCRFEEDNTDDGAFTSEGRESVAVPFQRVERKPYFQGGDANNFSKWVNEHLVYPKEAKDKGIQGKVILSFKITADGRVEDVRVLRGVCPCLDAEAVRVVSKSPKWIPGETGGKKVDVTYTFPVIFITR